MWVLWGQLWPGPVGLHQASSNTAEPPGSGPVRAVFSSLREMLQGAFLGGSLYPVEAERSPALTQSMLASREVV